MRPLLALLLLALGTAPFAAIPIAAQSGPGGGEDGDDGGSDDCGDGDDACDGTEAENESESPEADENGTDDAAEDESWDEDSDDRQRAKDAADARRADIEKVRRDLRDGLGLLQRDNSNWTGRYIAFSTDAPGGALRGFRVGDTLLFDAIYVPRQEADDERVRVDVDGNQLRIRGDDWRLLLADAPSAAMQMRASDDAGSFRLELPAAASVEQTRFGVILEYPTSSGTLTARIVGDVVPDPSAPRVLEVAGEAVLHVSASRVVLGNVANQHRPELEAALERRALGAEVSVLRTPAGIVHDATVYEDMSVALAEGGVAGGASDPGRVYTVTLDSADHAGRTVVVNFELGLLDPHALALRHFDVIPNRTLEIPIVRADGIADVLDPENDGSIAEYWVVEDSDGVQVLLSMPTFSVHQIELSSVGDVVLERPSLVLGALGAVLLVGLATAGLFRRPRDPEDA